MVTNTSQRHAAERLKHGDVTLADFTCGGIVLSDRASRGEYQDKAGPALEDAFSKHGAKHILPTEVIPDDSVILQQTIHGLQARGAHLVVTSGGTGLGPRDITPDTLLEMADKVVPGLGELIRAIGARHTPTSYLSRSVAVICKGTLIIALPGNPKAVEESFEGIGPILPHALATMLKGS